MLQRDIVFSLSSSSPSCVGVERKALRILVVVQCCRPSTTVDVDDRTRVRMHLNHNLLGFPRRLELDTQVCARVLRVEAAAVGRIKIVGFVAKYGSQFECENTFLFFLVVANRVRREALWIFFFRKFSWDQFMQDFSLRTNLSN